jgi:hypothetical protein
VVPLEPCLDFLPSRVHLGVVPVGVQAILKVELLGFGEITHPGRRSKTVPGSLDKFEAILGRSGVNCRENSLQIHASPSERER